MYANSTVTIQSFDHRTKAIAFVSGADAPDREHAGTDLFEACQRAHVKASAPGTGGPNGARSESDRDDAPTLRSELRSGSRPVDVPVLAAAPAVLVGAFLLPEPVRQSLTFRYADPTLPTAFTAHYVHLDAGHLVANLLGYGLLAGVGYALAVTSRRRRFFLAALATFCLAYPVALSALNLAVPRQAVGFGFSGVNMALLGVLPSLLAAFARAQFFPRASTRALPAVFFLLIGWIAVLALPASTSGLGLAGLAVAVAGLVLAAVYAASARDGSEPSLGAVVEAVVDTPGHGDLFAVGVVVLLAYPVVGFPADPTAGGSVVNLYVHLLGFALAFIGSYAALATGVFEE